MTFFTEQDFREPLYGNQIDWSNAFQQMADIANAKLKKESITAFGYEDVNGRLVFEMRSNIDPTHEALIMNIKEIK